MPHKLFCFIQWLAFFISATLIFCKGFGSREVYDVSIGFFVSMSLFFAKRKFFIIYILLLAIHIAFSGISLLWGFVFILFSLNKHTFHYSILALVLWTLEAIDIIPNNIVHIVILVAVSNILTFFSEKHMKLAASFLTILCIAATIATMPFLEEPTYVEKYANSIYSSGNVFCENTHSSYIDTTEVIADKKIIRATPFLTEVPETQPGILVFEIDYPDSSRYATHEVWQQPISWHDNQLFGNQYYLEAIRHDGGLYSNKGVTLKSDSGKVLLSFPSTIFESQPLIVEHDKTLCLHDSDYMSSFISNYQKCFQQELCKNSLRPNLIRMINILLLVLAMLLLFEMRYLYLASFAVGCFVLLYFTYAYKKDGNIRMVGNITNSHENNKFDGVPKMLVLSGYDYVIGDKNCSVLVVQKSHVANVKTESLVVAEDDCLIKYKSEQLRVVNNPIGNKNGVIDARQWLYKGHLYDGILRIGNVKFVATGSPAKQVWKDLLD